MHGLGALFFLLLCSFSTLVELHRFNSKDSDGHSCGAIHGHRTRRHDQELFPRRPPSGSKYGNALQFETGQVIQYPKLGSPTKKFAVDFWIKPEGGQHNPSIIIHAYDKCAPQNDARGWFIGMREASVNSDLRIFFTMHTASAHSNKTIMSHQKLQAGRWVHIAATFGGGLMKLYVNQAKVAVGFGQKGMIFDTTTQNHKCDVLDIGGDLKRGLFYRGQIDKLRLWNHAITHRDLTKSLPENTIDNLMDKIVLDDDFDKSNALREFVTDSHPRYVRSTVPEDQHDLSIRKPPCGKTICDNPEVIRSYVKHPALRGSKHLRIRFINVMNDDGTNPTLTDAEINSQFELMQSAFSQYNITWKLIVESVKNSWLRSKVVLHECEVAQIGDRKCDDKCSFEILGWDGGDCQRRECPPEKRNNGVCDMECNNFRHNYDGGDCCKSSFSRCIDPNSENRRYLSVDDFKKKVGIDNRNALNVYVVNWTDQNLLGTAAFPWEKTVHTKLGGVTLPPNNFGTTKVLIHEIGHALGLWHVHHGSKSELKCSDDCIETFPSLELGDLCSDTNATIKNSKCSDPDVDEDDTCGLPAYKNTPYDNFMSYANDFCVNHFTPQQVARMHCYIDLDFQSWQTSAKPSFVPLPPRIISTHKDRIKLSWLPPLGQGGKNAINLCNECDEGHVLEQYATTAYSPMEAKPDRKYAAHQAIGPPDADHCSLTRLSWKPDELYLGTEPFYLDIGFKEAVVPTELAIWVPYESKDAFSDIVLMYIDGSTESIGNGTAQCDSPFMKALYVKKKVSKVRIYVSRSTVCIDAVKLTSGIGHPNCSKCKPLHYVIRREPPFDIGHEKRVATARFEDKNIDENGRYEYRVRAVTHEKISGPFSPALIYEPKRGFCGDGKIDKGENCDDGNVRDGDGCNIQCQMEDVFRCKGLPSLCYRHDGDGLCEEFEKQTSVKDCGFYTPEGFKDQWVYRATLNPKYTYRCPADGIIGPPRDDLKCEAENSLLCDICADGWCPSNEEYTETDHWIKVHFKNSAIASAIILYLAYIDIDLDKQPPTIKLELYDSKANLKSILEYKANRICKENPVRIPVQHDMTKPFFKTSFIKMMFDTRAKIAAVSLRSPKYFDPVGLQSCTGSQLFHPSTQKCYKYGCNLPKCSKLVLKHSKELAGRGCTKGKEEGETCMVTCDKGYKPSGPFELMCIRGEWLVDDEKPRCMPVDCGKPKIPNAKTVCTEGTTLNKKCIYKCKDGTKQSATATELSVTCESDGLWSATNIFCRRTCDSPTAPIHAMPRFKNNNKNCRAGKKFIPGEICSYRCKTGYKPLGPYQNKDVLDQRCLKDGSWSRKRCVPIRCPVRDPKIFRWYNCTLGNKYGSVCRLACPGEKVREVRCEQEGKWDKKFQMCSTKGSCPAPLNFNMDLTVTCGKHLKPGDECKVKCIEGFTSVVKGDSSKKPVKFIACSPFLKWYPDIREIKCTTTCNKDMIADGLCNAQNNNKDCQWDGGDCCDPDALKTDSLCGDDCDCRDITSLYYGSVASGDDRFSS